MAITMQGAWTVSVHAKNAAWPQRFVVSGAASGNGAHSGTPGTSVLVTGTAWAVQVQHNPGTGWVNSTEQIKFPTVAGGQYRVLIQSDDSGGDRDFDDLVLACTTPQTETDFLVYGSVSWYGANCIFNPCSRRWWVIDHLRAYELAIQNPRIRDLIGQVYPERLREPPFPPIGPDPAPFRPLVLSPEGGIPAKQSFAVTLQDTQVAFGAEEGRKAGTETVRTVSALRMIDDARAVQSRTLAVDRIAIAGLIDVYFRRCQSGPLPGVVLRFLEYDRTNAELAGGPYTGEGDREVLGVCATDSNGNYLFRFQRSVAQRIGEALGDTAPGEDALVQSAPDLIVQVLDPMSPEGVRWESAPYWNVPLLRRIDVCVPELRPVTACQGQHAIQAIGNIFIGAPASAAPPGPPVPTARVGYSNMLSASGRITAANPAGPITECSAWRGRLDLYACFLDVPVQRYTIRYRRPGEGWSFFSDTYRHPKVANIAVPGYLGEVVGPHSASVSPEGETPGNYPTYTNIERDDSYIFTHRNRKAQISSGQLVAGAGQLQLWIEGYDASGNRVAEDALTLFIDNTPPLLGVAEVSMGDGSGGVQEGGDCALFTLPTPGQPLKVRWRAADPDGSMRSFGLTVRRGNAGNLPVSGSGAALTGAYAHGSAHVCTPFRGTADQPTADAAGYVESDVFPTGGAWLPAGVPFCTFAVQVSGSQRVTDGYHGDLGSGPSQYLLGIQA
jgi:hypothetical protein